MYDHFTVYLFKQFSTYFLTVYMWYISCICVDHLCLFYYYYIIISLSLIGHTAFRLRVRSRVAQYTPYDDILQDLLHVLNVIHPNKTCVVFDVPLYNNRQFRFTWERNNFTKHKIICFHNMIYKIWKMFSSHLNSMDCVKLHNVVHSCRHRIICVDYNT